MTHDAITERIRDAADLIAIISGYVRLRKLGASMVGLCPFHKEKTPSFNVTPGKQTWYCFGCGAKGNAFQFVMQIEGISFLEARRILAERYAISLDTGDTSAEQLAAEARQRVYSRQMGEEVAWYWKRELEACSERGASLSIDEPKGWRGDAWRKLIEKNVERYQWIVNAKPMELVREYQKVRGRVRPLFEESRKDADIVCAALEEALLACKWRAPHDEGAAKF